MATSLPTASGIDRATKCIGSLRLPVVQSTNEDQQRGTVAHAFMEAIGNGKTREEALALVAGDSPGRTLCEAIPVEELPSGGYREVTFAYSTRGSRVLGVGLERDYESAEPDEWVGTADFAGTVGDLVIVIDYKTGRDQGDPRESGQLRMLALAAARHYRKTAVRVAFAYPREDGDIVWSGATFDAFDLVEIAEDLEILRARAREPKLEFVEGEWCRYCPGFDFCPAKARLAASLMVADSAAVLPTEDEVVGLSTQQAGEAYLAVTRIEELVERIKTALRERAKRSPIPLGNGFVLKEVPWPSSVIDHARAWEALVKAQGQQQAEKMMPRKATLTALRTVGVLDELEKSGAVKKISSPQVRAVREKKNKGE